VKRLMCWRRRSCTVGLTSVNAAGAEVGGAVIAFQSSPCLWKKRSGGEETVDRNEGTKAMGKRYGKGDDWDQLLVQRRDWS